MPTKTFMECVREFNATFGVHVNTKPTILSKEVKELRSKLIKEEYEELIKCIEDDDVIGIADGCADLHYVVSGTSLAYGIPEDLVFREVHRSNMSKADPDGTVHKRSDGKVLKSVHYTPPDIAPIILGALKPDPGRAAFDAGPVAL